MVVVETHEQAEAENLRGEDILSITEFQDPFSCSAFW